MYGGTSYRSARPGELGLAPGSRPGRGYYRRMVALRRALATLRREARKVREGVC